MKRLALGLFAALVPAGPAAAHPDPAGHGAFAAGFGHPMLGLDHILAMVAVGLWAAMLGGRALWTLPLAFVGAMCLGFAGARAGLALPMVEPMILASALLLGGIVALALHLPLPVAAGIVGGLALFHGHAHGTEMEAAQALAYIGGFASATTLLHAAGAVAGRALAGAGGDALPRLLGGVTALGGLALAVA